jgi:hypothetical protein
MVEGGVDVQARRVLDNIGAILKSAGLRSPMSCTTVYRRHERPEAANHVYAHFFGTLPRPLDRKSRDCREMCGLKSKPRRVADQCSTRQLDTRHQNTKKRRILVADVLLPRYRIKNARRYPGSVHAQHAIHRAQRLDHLLRCLRSLTNVMSMRARLSSSVCASMFLMLVLMSATRAHGSQQPLPIFDFHRQFHGARDSSFPLSPLDIDAAFRIVEQVDTLGQVAEWTDTPLPRVMCRRSSRGSGCNSAPGLPADRRSRAP